MLRELRANAAAEMTSEMKLQAAASVAPVTQGDEPGVSPAMSCTRAEQREAACTAQAAGENSVGRTKLTRRERGFVNETQPDFQEARQTLKTTRTTFSCY